MIFQTIGYCVAFTLVVVFSSLFCRILRRGKFEASGYAIDWKSSPLGMVAVLSSLFATVAIIVWGLVIQWKANPEANVEPYEILLDVRPNEWPDFGYDGPGVVRERSMTLDEAGRVQFSFSAMSLPPGTSWELNGANDLREYRVFDFSGTISCTDATCRLMGDLWSRCAGTLWIRGAQNRVYIRGGENRIDVSWNRPQPSEHTAEQTTFPPPEINKDRGAMRAAEVANRSLAT